MKKIYISKANVIDLLLVGSVKFFGELTDVLITIETNTQSIIHLWDDENDQWDVVISKEGVYDLLNKGSFLGDDYILYVHYKLNYPPTLK
jgi:hypothetical protein